jgi:hypothetical protein
MPIDINVLRADRGGDPEKWREYMKKRFKPVELIDNVLQIDQVREDPARCARIHQHGQMRQIWLAINSLQLLLQPIRPAIHRDHALTSTLAEMLCG